MGNGKTFSDSRLGVFCCGHVFEGHRPVLLVAHEEHGDWQFVCGSEDHTYEDDIHHACVGHLIDSDSTLSEISDLPRGLDAERSSTAVEWIRTARINS